VAASIISAGNEAGTEPSDHVQRWEDTGSEGEGRKRRGDGSGDDGCDGVTSDDGLQCRRRRLGRRRHRYHQDTE